MRTTLIMIVLAALAAGTWFASRQRQGLNVPATSAAGDRPLGYYLRGARLLGTDEQGRVIYRILADRLDEVPDEQRLQLEGVRVEYSPADETPWGISAARASTPRDRSRLDLTGDVELKSSPTDGSTPISIATQQLRFSPDTSEAESDETVRIRVGDWQLEAKGLRTHLKGDTLELESEVHGKFAP